MDHVSLWLSWILVKFCTTVQKPHLKKLTKVTKGHRNWRHSTCTFYSITRSCATAEGPRNALSVKILSTTAKNAQRDGRPAEYRWRPMFQRRKVWLTPTTRVPCSKAAKTRNPLKFAGVPQTKPLVSRSSPYYVDMLLNKFFSDCRYMP